MSVAAAGGMGGSDDGNGDGEKKRNLTGNDLFLQSTDRDINGDDDGEEKEEKKRPERRNTFDSMDSLRSALPRETVLPNLHKRKPTSFEDFSRRSLDGKIVSRILKRRMLRRGRGPIKENLIISSKTTSSSSVSSLQFSPGNNKDEDKEDDNKNDKNQDEDVEDNNKDAKNQGKDGEPTP